MAEAVELYFDLDADAAVRDIWADLEAAGVPSLRTMTHRQHQPHVSLFSGESLSRADLGPLRDVLGSALSTRPPVLRLDAVGTFPGPEGVVFLGVTVTAELLAWHAEAHAALAGQPVGLSPYYRPGRWVPHCTVSYGLVQDQIPKAIGALSGYQPIEATVSAAGIIDGRSGEVNWLVER